MGLPILVFQRNYTSIYIYHYLLTFSSCDKLIILISAFSYWLETHSLISVQLVLNRVPENVLQFSCLRISL